MCDTCIRELIVLDVPLQVRVNSLNTKIDSNKHQTFHSVLSSSKWLLIDLMYMSYMCFYSDETSKFILLLSIFIPHRINSILLNSHPFLFLFQKLATISHRQFSRMEWRTTVRPTHRARVCSRL